MNTIKMNRTKKDPTSEKIQLLEKIKKCRKQKNLSQAQMASIIGISQAAYAKIESGDTSNITIDIGKGIAKALEISFTELFDIEDIGQKDIHEEIGRLTKRIEELDNQIKDKNLIIKYYELRRIYDSGEMPIIQIELENEILVIRQKELSDLDKLYKRIDNMPLDEQYKMNLKNEIVEKMADTTKNETEIKKVHISKIFNFPAD